MVLGLLKDIKKNEYRVILTPSEISAYVEDGHTVYVEHNAGSSAGFEDEAYEAVGAIITDKLDIYDKCEFIVKVKEIEESEYDLLKEGQFFYT